MNAFEILGKAAVNRTFRQALFNNVEGIISENRSDLSPEQIDGLRRLVQPLRPVPEGARVAPEENNLDSALDAVAEAVMKMCPREPCGWP
jgi:hypothetical protein